MSSLHQVYIQREQQTQTKIFLEIHRLSKKIEKLNSESTRLQRIARILAKRSENKEKDVKLKKEEKLYEKIRLQQTSDLGEMLEQTGVMFRKFDTNQNGVLDGDEILLLSKWVWTTFMPQGTPLRRCDQIKMGKNLLERCDKNNDGKIDFDEFAEWFIITANRMKEHRKAKKNPGTLLLSQSSSGDGRDEESVENRQALTPPKRSKKYVTRESPRDMESPVATRLKENVKTVKIRKPKLRLARNRVQLFLRLDVSHDNTLDENDLTPIISKCGYDSFNVKLIYDRLCKHFASDPASGIRFKQFKLDPKANENDLVTLIHSLSSNI